MEAETAWLACVALGLLKQPSSTDGVWGCYRRLRALPQESYFIGGLWGLIDLGDPRVAGEIYDFLEQSRYFYELYGFLSLAGDEQALGLLIDQALEKGPEEGAEALMAVTGIVHRLGKPALVHALLNRAQTEPGNIKSEALAQAQEVAAMFLHRPLKEVQDYFALFYRGFKPQDAAVADELIRQNKG